jgi:hypothetical protein
MINSRSMIWAGHAACIGRTKNEYKILVVKPEGKRHLGYLVVQGKGKVVPVLN